jgi:hypothetical protein
MGLPTPENDSFECIVVKQLQVCAFRDAVLCIRVFPTTWDDPAHGSSPIIVSLRRPGGMLDPHDHDDEAT